MTTTTKTVSTHSSLVAGVRPPGAFGDRVFRYIALLGGLAVLLVLGLIAVSTTHEAWPAFTAEGLSFVFSDNWDPAAGHFGAAAFVFGTLLVSGIALVMAVPVSVGIALFMTEVAPKKLRPPMLAVMDLLATVPSVVYGLWGISVLAPWIADRYATIESATQDIPVLSSIFTGNQSGRSFMTAGIILALMITPIIAAVTREVFDTVPRAQKDAALALGATRWEMIRGAVFPHGRNGMVAATMIGLGRAMGETIAVALVIGSSPKISAELFGSGDTMAAVIANNFGEATGTFRAALIGLGVVLFAVTIVIGMLARGVANRSERRLGRPS